MVSPTAMPYGPVGSWHWVLASTGPLSAGGVLSTGDAVSVGGAVSVGEALSFVGALSFVDALSTGVRVSAADDPPSWSGLPASAVGVLEELEHAAARSVAKRVRLRRIAMFKSPFRSL
jgi:hypothetical protein